ncbi:hypothetical protein TUSST3_24100 [Streptomyces sp. TUS-ST3]|nr:hypothetical protein TUSST3_24100 [Streptomyces sp. TUS-ST3]
MNQQLLAKTFVELADNLVADFDLIDFLRLLTDRCVSMLDASAAGVLLADRDGKLRVMAASTNRCACWSSSSSRTTRAPAWSASVPAHR